MTIEVKVQTKSSQPRLERLGDQRYKAYLKSSPIDNRANQELKQLIAREFKVKRYQVEIISGLTARQKVIRIDQ